MISDWRRPLHRWDFSARQESACSYTYFFSTQGKYLQTGDVNTSLDVGQCTHTQTVSKETAYGVSTCTGIHSLIFSNATLHRALMTNCLWIKKRHTEGEAGDSDLITAITGRNVRDQTHIWGLDHAAHLTCMSERDLCLRLWVKMKLSLTAEEKANRRGVLSYMLAETAL